MIKFALVCERSHEFESWFPDGESYETQARRGLVQCAHCDSRSVSKAIMAPAVRLSRADEAPRPVALLDDKQKELRAALVAVRKAVEANTDDVGPRFPEVARAIHLGEEPDRAIRGQASPSEARALLEEGIAVLPVPLLPDETN